MTDFFKVAGITLLMFVFFRCDLMSYDRQPCDSKYTGTEHCDWADAGENTLQNVTNLTATPKNEAIALTWDNPTSPDFSGVKVLRRTDGFPASPFDGDVVYNNVGTGFTDPGLTNGITYYYAVFSFDTALHYSSGVTVSATPGEGFNIATIDSSPKVGKFSGLALDSAQKIHICYYDATSGTLKYITNSSGSFSPMTLDSTADVGRYAAIAVDSRDMVHISYHDYGHSTLKYIANTSGSWVPMVIDSGSTNVGGYTSIAIDSSDKAHISYYDYFNFALKYITNVTGSWVSTTIDSPSMSGSTGDAGWNTAIAVDLNGQVHISYRSRNYVKYATNKSGTWVIQTIDPNLGVYEGYTSIKADGNGKVHLSFYDNVNDTLKYATNSSGTWALSTIDSSGDVGEYNSLAVDTQNQVYVSYYDNNRFALKYATNSSGTWESEFVESVSNQQVGLYSSIAVGLNGVVYISYYDATHESLKYADNAQ